MIQNTKPILKDTITKLEEEAELLKTITASQEETKATLEYFAKNVVASPNPDLKDSGSANCYIYYY